ncbi:DNA topoisomerase I [Candidatus Bathyarchaeota archaeon]|nr:DNA topoisomerase I [Candidatus Bathyarchaeota archaeon]
MERLHHNGVLIPPRYEGKELGIKVNGREIKLTTEQEERALAWAKKLGTPYVEDPVFIENFHLDFSRKLGVEVKHENIDYSEILTIVEKEREQKTNLSREEKKKLATQRKIKREANKEKYGYAWLDGERVEISNYVAEPSSIFMGRGKHPMRGRWKEGPQEEDIVLNLSPEAPRPQGNWKEIIWNPNSMWIARWQDKLSGKIKYVWFSDSVSIKQEKEIEKFDKARKFGENLSRIHKHVRENLESDDLKRRKTATICFLIDKLKIRVGDEKDPDEADTVGASTLRPEHVQFNNDGTIAFNFLGKDSVPHFFSTKLPEKITKNLKEFATNGDSTLFDGIGSKHVSEFLDEVMTGLSSKAFRTYYASDAVETKLEKISVDHEDAEYVKKHVATMANLTAAKVCNHRRTISKNWQSSLEKKKERLKVLKKRAKVAQAKIKQKIIDHGKKTEIRKEKQEKQLNTTIEKLTEIKRQIEAKKKQDKPFAALEKRLKLKRKSIANQKERIRKMKSKHSERIRKLRQNLDDRKLRDETALEKQKLKIEAQKETRDYNLTTSLKSYIDPRVYYEWGKRVNYDWKNYYPKSLHKKFSWVETKEIQQLQNN